MDFIKPESTRKKETQPRKKGAGRPAAADKSVVLYKRVSWRKFERISRVVEILLQAENDALLTIADQNLAQYRKSPQTA